jgi:hypothetical protein
MVISFSFLDWRGWWRAFQGRRDMQLLLQGTSLIVPNDIAAPWKVQRGLLRRGKGTMFGRVPQELVGWRMGRRILGRILVWQLGRVGLSEQGKEDLSVLSV